MKHLLLAVLLCILSDCVHASAIAEETPVPQPLPIEEPTCDVNQWCWKHMPVDA